jgi:hypothetical protein
MDSVNQADANSENDSNGVQSSRFGRKKSAEPGGDSLVDLTKLTCRMGSPSPACVWRDHALHEMNENLSRHWKDPDPLARIGWVYFVVAPEIGRIKIGHTDGHPRKRLAALNQNCPLEIEGIGLLRGSVRVERTLHGLFQDIRWRHEWFLPESILQGFITAHALPWVAADSIDSSEKIPLEEAAKIVSDMLMKIEQWKDKNHRDFEWASRQRKRNNVARTPCEVDQLEAVAVYLDRRHERPDLAEIVRRAGRQLGIAKGLLRKLKEFKVSDKTYGNICNRSSEISKAWIRLKTHAAYCVGNELPNPDSMDP